MSQQILNALFWATFFLLTFGSFIVGIHVQKIYEANEGFYTFLGVVLVVIGSIMLLVIATHVVIAP